MQNNGFGILEGAWGHYLANCWVQVVSALISVATDMSPTGDVLVTLLFAGEASSRARSETAQWKHNPKP